MNPETTPAPNNNFCQIQNPKLKDLSHLGTPKKATSKYREFQSKIPSNFMTP